MNPGDSNPLKTAVVLLLLTAAYGLGAYLVSDFCGGPGAHWAVALQQFAGLPKHAVSLLLSLIGMLGLLMCALPLAGIIATLYPSHAAGYALLVAIPATLSMLADVYVLWHIGLQIPNAARALIAFDAAKTLMIPPLLALLAPRWLPQRALSR